MLKKLTESIALFSVVIIIFGLAKQYLYYLNFGVPINYFLTISELGIIVSDDILIICMVVGIILFGSYLLLNTKIPIETIERQQKKEEQILEELKFTNPKQYKKIVRSKTSLILLLIVGAFVALTTSKEYSFKLISVSVLVLMAPYFILIFRPALLYKHLSSNTAYTYLTIALFIIVYVSFVGVQVSNVEHGKFAGTIITTNDSTYISTTERYFIGKTDKFVFFYDARVRATSIIPMDKVSTIILKQN